MHADKRAWERQGAETDRELESFRISSRPAIASVFRSMAARRELITDEWQQTLAIVGVHEDDHWVYFDDPASRRQRERLLRGRTIAFFGYHGKVRVHFTIEQLRPVELEDGLALRAALPDKLIRMQRREIFRQPLPAIDRLSGCFMLRDGTPVNVTVVDLSIGGMAVLEPERGPQVDWSPGRLYDEFRIQLPGLGTVVTDIEIRNSFVPDGEQTRRIGCRFVNVSRQQVMTLQRYIQRVERLRRQPA